MSKKETPHCHKCGSPNVRIDAWSCWDDIKQEWVLAETFDQAFCPNCEGETRIEWKTEGSMSRAIPIIPTGIMK